MEKEYPQCFMKVVEEETSAELFSGMNINIVELEAIKISGNVYCNGMYYKIKSMAYNCEYYTLEIFV